MRKRQAYLVIVAGMALIGALVWRFVVQGKEQKDAGAAIPVDEKSWMAASPGEKCVVVSAGQTAEASSHGIKVFSRTGEQQDARLVQASTMEMWAEEGTEEGVAKVIAKAQADPSLKERAVRALSRSKSEKALEYVQELLVDENVEVMCAAIDALGTLKGEESVNDIAWILEDNRERKDGYQEQIAAACIKALGETRSSGALPVLQQELQWVSQQEAAPAYGLELIEAVGDIGDSRGADMLDLYAEELEGNLAGSPTVRRQQMLQIAKARLKADDLR